MAKRQNKSKAAALRAVMGDKRLAEDIFAGQLAPHGSTKRKKASSILMSVHGGMNPDGLGAGGLAVPGQDPNMPKVQTKLQTAPVLGPSLPGALPKPPVQVAPSLDSLLKLNSSGGVDMPRNEPAPQSGAGQFSMAGRSQDLASAVPSYMAPGELTAPKGLSIPPGNVGLEFTETGEAKVSEPSLAFPGSERKTPPQVQREIGATRPGSLEAPPAGLTSGSAEKPQPLAETKSPYTFQEANTFYDACMSSSVADLGGQTQHQYCYLQAQQKTGKTPTVSAVGKYSPDDMGPTASDTSPIDLQDMMEYAAATGDVSELEAWIAELKKTNPELADQMATPVEATIEAIAKGMTLGEFQTNMLLNPKRMADALGVPLETMESFTFDLFGGEKAEDLQDIARKKFQLNQWESALMDRQAEHLTASVKFKDYIRGKDEYLGKLDEMLYKLGEQRNSIDMSDPQMAARFQNYRNYLVGLKGAQSKRYIDMLNDSIQVENADYDRFVSLYETKVNQVSDFVTQQLSQQNIDQQRAQRLLPYVTDALTGIYRAANGIDDVKQEKDKLEINRLMETANIIKTLKDVDFDMEKLKEINPELSKYIGAIKPEGTDLLSGGDKDFTETKYNSIVRVDEEDGKITTVEVFGIRDLIEMGKSLELKNIEHLTERYGRDVAMVLENDVAANGKLDAALEPYMKALESDMDLDETEYAVAEKYLDRIVDGAQKGMKRYLVESQAGTMKTIMTKMLAGKIKTKEDLVSKYGGKIDAYLLETLWAVDEALRQEILDGSPGIYGSLEEVPHFGIDKSEWNTLLSDPEAMASYFLGEI